MHPLGLLKVFSFLGAWLLGCAIFPLAIVCAWFKVWLPAQFIIFYYMFRYFVPASKSDWIRELLCISETPYFNSQKIIFDEGASAPTPRQPVMLAVGPHGILALGWSFANTCREFIKADIYWLIAPILLHLPIARDFMYVKSILLVFSTSFMFAGYGETLLPVQLKTCIN